jgi:hypothetical protein
MLGRIRYTPQRRKFNRLFIASSSLSILESSVEALATVAAHRLYGRPSYRRNTERDWLNAERGKTYVAYEKSVSNECGCVWGQPA